MTPEQWEAGRPSLTPENEIVIRVWNFCDGWNPALVPLAADYFQVIDVDFLLEQLLAMRQAVDAHREALRQARG